MPKIETLKESNSFYILPTFRIVRETDYWKESLIYLSIDLSWFNKSLSFVFKEDGKYL
jgi:hypothetical protein